MAANGYQKHILVGNLGANPKVNQTKSGQLVTNFDIAVNERNRDGTEVVTWYGITAWNGLGEACAEYLAKGRQVMVEGTRMEATAWMGRDGNLYTKMELTANEVRFLGGGDNNGQQQAPRKQQAPQRQVPRQQQVREQQQQTPQQQQPARRQSAPAPRQRRQRQQRQQQAPTPQQQAAHGYIPDNPEEYNF